MYVLRRACLQVYPGLSFYVTLSFDELKIDYKFNKQCKDSHTHEFIISSSGIKLSIHYNMMAFIIVWYLHVPLIPHVHQCRIIASQVVIGTYKDPIQAIK